uniref:Mothers against decapentaplegic-like protein 6 n=1 Tax=Magallana gigas TaxID=29159 RepID=K1QIR4_MAGGI
MEEKLECAARVTVRSAAARSIKSYKGGDAVLSGNKGENDLHFWDQSIAHYRALPVRRPASPRRRGMDWSTGASNSGSVIEELVYIGMRAELPATTYTRATGATRGALSYYLSEGEEPGSEVTTHWCSVAYWELRQRVGRLYTLHEPYLCIFQDLPHGNGLSLSLVQEPTSVDCVKRTREKIGLGLVLSREADGVWLYNRSGYPVFVNSPTLDNPSSRASVVIKVNPGYSMNIFNYDMASVLRAVKERHCLDGPYDPTSIRISFAKGWGPSYHRQFITSCPAWLEVLLNVNR